ncbi:hypothetical protein GCM10009573_01950 [Agromyces bracchium]
MVGQDEDEDEPDEPEALEPDAPDFAELERVDEPDPEDFDAVEPEPDDFDVDDFAVLDFDADDFAPPEDFEPDPSVVDPSDICRTSFLALSSTVSLTSPTRAIAKSFTVCTPSCTAGWFQTPSAALRICS